MTATVKIMPCLDMKNGRVVKGIHFVELKDAGDPVENAAFYQKEGADELAMLDIAATLENRKTRLEWVRNVSAVIRIPLTVGGGVFALDGIDLLLAAGAAKGGNRGTRCGIVSPYSHGRGGQISNLSPQESRQNFLVVV